MNIVCFICASMFKSLSKVLKFLGKQMRSPLFKTLWISSSFSHFSKCKSKQQRCNRSSTKNGCKYTKMDVNTLKSHIVSCTRRRCQSAWWAWWDQKGSLGGQRRTQLGTGVGARGEHQSPTDKATISTRESEQRCYQLAASSQHGSR